MKNDNYGIILYYADKNAVFLNTLTENKNGGILLVHSNDNQIWGNYAGMNWNGITLETSRGNTIMSNNFTRNKMGINISNINISESIKTKGQGSLHIVRLRQQGDHLQNWTERHELIRNRCQPSLPEQPAEQCRECLRRRPQPVGQRQDRQPLQQLRCPRAWLQ